MVDGQQVRLSAMNNSIDSPYAILNGSSFSVREFVAGKRAHVLKRDQQFAPAVGER